MVKDEMDFTGIAEKIKRYFDSGFIISSPLTENTLYLREDPSVTSFSSLHPCGEEDIDFWAIDCSTRTLCKTVNWGVYLLRVASVSVNAQNREVTRWNRTNHIEYVEGSSEKRANVLSSCRFELESKLALDSLNKINENDYLLLDGASRFGKPQARRFSDDLFQKARKKKLKLLAISKQTKILRDSLQRDLVAQLCKLAPFPTWVYITSKKADPHEHLYGNISVIKLSSEVPQAFRCDIMHYLGSSGEEVVDLLSPLLSISNDAHCLGYPYSLYKAHDFSQLSHVELFFQRKKLEEALVDYDLLESVVLEESSVRFVNKLHGINYCFERESFLNV